MTSRAVLLVDDHADNRAVYAILLQHHGYTVLEAANGREAIELARRFRPALTVMDIAMPVMDGIEATRALRAASDTRGLRIVALTAMAGPEHRSERDLFDLWLQKPLEPRRMIELVGQIVGKGDDGADGGAPEPPTIVIP